MIARMQPIPSASLAFFPCASDAFALSDGVRNGLPVKRFVKEILRTGTYSHPIDKWTLSLDESRLDRMAKTFSDMRANGIDIPVVVDHSFKAEDVRGYLTEVWRDGDRLMGIHEMIGDDSIKLAQTVRNTSVWIEPEFVDSRHENGKQKKWTDALLHNAIVQLPIVTGMGGFEAIAASMFADRPAQPLVPTTGEKTMDLTKIKAALGTDADLTEENLADAITAALTAEREKVTAAEAKASITASHASGASSGDNSNGPSVSSRSVEITPDEDSLALIAEATGEKIDALVASGHVTPAVAASLKGKFIGEPGKYNAYAMSAAFSGRPTSITRDIIDLFKQNGPVLEFKEKTKGQALSHDGRDGGDIAKRQAEIDSIVKTMTGGK